MKPAESAKPTASAKPEESTAPAESAKPEASTKPEESAKPETSAAPTEATPEPSAPAAPEYIEPETAVDAALKHAKVSEKDADVYKARIEELRGTSVYIIGFTAGDADYEYEINALTGKVEGWDDPRLCTLAGIRRRGYTPEAIRKFCNDIGVTKADTMIDIAQLEQCVREDLQLKVPAINVVKNPIKVIIDNYPEDKIEMCTVENNSKVPEMGTREIPFGRELWVDGDDFMEVPAKKYFRLFPGNEVRFKGAYFITCNEVEKDADGNIVCLHCTYDPETHSGSGFEGRKVKGTIHFVEASTAVKIKIREYGYLMKENEETGEMEFDPESLKETWGYAEPSVKDVKAGERFQFFRKGYYIADSELTTDDEKVFNSIVGLKSSWK